MKIIACLGNPGNKYKKNRHNTGFIFGRYLADELNININRKSFHSNFGLDKINGQDVLLQFPDTYMNKSGIAVREAMQFYKKKPEDLIAVHDEIELPFGNFNIKFGGGHKGNNGIRSIIQEIGTPDFYRLRIGVGRPEESGSVADYVLSNFTDYELSALNKKFSDIYDELISILRREKNESDSPIS